MENLATGCGPGPGVSQVHRMLSVPKRLSRSSRTRQEGTVRRPAFLRSRRGTGNAAFGRTQPRGVAQGSAWPGLLYYHEVLHGGLSRRDPHYGQRHHPAQGARSGRVLRSLDQAVPEDARRLNAWGKNSVQVAIRRRAMKEEVPWATN